MTLEQLQVLGLDEQWLQPLNDTFDRYEINTAQRQACFVGQCLHESGGFKQLSENLNYSAKGLMATWPSRFNQELATQCERQPEKIANVVYGGRLGNTVEGDGWKYHGRGLIQLTGKENYLLCGTALGADLINNPDLLTTPEYAALSAGWFWGRKWLNTYADSNDIEGMTRRINGGLIGLDDRKVQIAKVLKVL